MALQANMLLKLLICQDFRRLCIVVGFSTMANIVVFCFLSYRSVTNYQTFEWKSKDGCHLHVLCYCRC